MSVEIGSGIWAGLLVALAASAPAVPDELDLARLAPPAEDRTVQLAEALWQARAGDLPAALARVEGVLESAPDDARLARERDRLTTLLWTRETWLTGLPEGRGKLFVERDGKKTSLKVEAYVGGVLRLGRNRLNLESLVANELPVAGLLGLARGLPEDAPGWVVPYARLLGGEANWDRKLDGETPDGRALAEDAAEITGSLPLGRVAATLEGLAALELSGEGALAPADVAPTLAAIGDLMGSDGMRVVDERRDDLRALAHLALGATYDDDPGELPLAGRAEWLGGGGLRLTYEFEDTAEADDFELRADYLPEWHATMTPVPKAPEDSYFIVKQGAFFGDGQLVYRHRLEFGPGVRVRYQMRYVPRDESSLDVGVVMIGLADDGAGSFAAASDFGDVYALDLETFYNEKKLFEGRRTLGINKIYEAEARLELDDELGPVIEAWREGKLRNELPAGARERGGVFLFVHSPRIVAIESMVIEGVPEPPSLEALRAEWIGERLAELGFGG